MPLECRLQRIDTVRHFTPSVAHSAVIASDLYQCASAVLPVSVDVKATGFGAARASGALHKCTVTKRGPGLCQSRFEEGGVTRRSLRASVINE